MVTSRAVFLEIIEWFDETGREMFARIPASGSGEIKYGAQLIVRESQTAAFFYHGKAIHVFGPGRHTLKTANIPILNKIIAVPWGLTSPLRAEVYFLNMKLFANQKWGTRDPVAFKDSELGLIRLRAFGQFNMQIVQPLLFINFLVGTAAAFSTSDIEDYLSSVIVSRFNDYLGEHLGTFLNLPGMYDRISEGLKALLQRDFNDIGLGLPHLFITSITPPADVQKAIDDRSRLAVFDDLQKLIQLKAAMAMERAAENPGGAGEGMGLGVGFMMPAMLSHALQPRGRESTTSTQTCPDCGQEIPEDARFCPQCGHQIVVILRCVHCGKNLPAQARFCSRCGRPVEARRQSKPCANCGSTNLTGAVYCNQCGERLGPEPPE